MIVPPQLTLDLLAPEACSFDNFLAGENEELVAQMRDLAEGRRSEPCLFLWGEAGAGKTHLLQAALGAAVTAGRKALLLGRDAILSVSGEPALIAIDDLDRWPGERQADLFSLYNDLRAAGGTLLAASRQPLPALALREDLRTRLGWGLIYEVHPLRDEAKAQALIDYARRRGFRLPEEVVHFLLSRARRDLPTLLSLLAALDQYSLAAQRPVTIPLVRDLLQRSLGACRT